MRPKMYLFGDSITEESFDVNGWGSQLAHHFSRTMDVVLRGYSGYNTRWALKVLKKVLPAEGSGPEPVAVTVFFGANDACIIDRCSGFQHVPIPEYKQNLISIVALLKNQWPNSLVLLITPPPIYEEARLDYPYIENEEGLPERTNEAAGAYAKACIEVANECGLPVIDLWTKMQQHTDWQKTVLRDGLHLNVLGNTIVFREVMDKLKEHDLCLEKLPVDQPAISDINPFEPLKAFEDY